MAEQDYNLGDIIDIDYQIANNLDYKSLVRLMTTNRRFHSYRNQESFKLLLKEKYDELFGMVRQQLYSFIKINFVSHIMETITILNDIDRHYITLFHNTRNLKIVSYGDHNIAMDTFEEKTLSSDEAINYLIDNRLYIRIVSPNKIGGLNMVPEIAIIKTSPNDVSLDIDKYFREMMKI